MIAEDYATSSRSAEAVYDVVKSRLLSLCRTPKRETDKLLTVVYLLDSILKNAKGRYLDFVDRDAETWLPVVYANLPDQQQKTKLRKVWTTWGQFELFQPERLRAMGRCFSASQNNKAIGTVPPNVVIGTTISRTVRICLC